MAGFFQMRERRALVVFLLLAGVFVAGLLLAERRESAVSADRVEAEMEATVAADSVRLFEFDPNTVEYADLRRLGLTSRMAVSLLKYRAAGKVFRIPEDVAACYGMTDSVYFILEPYIRIGREYALTPSPRREYREYLPRDDRAPRTIQDRYGVRILSRVARFFRPSGRGYCPLSGSLRRSSGRSGFSGLLYDRRFGGRSLAALCNFSGTGARSFRIDRTQRGRFGDLTLGGRDR